MMLHSHPNLVNLLGRRVSSFSRQVSLEEVDLRVKLRTGSPEEQAAAEKLLPLVRYFRVLPNSDPYLGLCTECSNHSTFSFHLLFIKRKIKVTQTTMLPVLFVAGYAAVASSATRYLAVMQFNLQRNLCVCCTPFNIDTFILEFHNVEMEYRYTQ